MSPVWLTSSTLDGGADHDGDDVAEELTSSDPARAATASAVRAVRNHALPTGAFTLVLLIAVRSTWVRPPCLMMMNRG
jgi:hypothetical protein